MTIEISYKIIKIIEEWCKRNNYNYNNITIIRFTPGGIILTFKSKTATIVVNKKLEEIDLEVNYNYGINDLKFEL